MKALLVADDEKAIDNISQVLKSKGYDTIVYKWLLKALDNIEEIAPHLIVVSTLDYPRHWKTLAQYATSGFGDYAPQVILYTDENFGEEEQKKAEALHIRGIFDSVGVEGLDKLREILEKNDDIYSGNDVAEMNEAQLKIDNKKTMTDSEIEDIAKNEADADKLEQMAGDEIAADKLERFRGNEEINPDEEVPTVDALTSGTYENDDFTLPGLDELRKLLDENEFASPENNDIIEEEADSTVNTEAIADSDEGENDMADEQSIDDKLAEIMNANKADQKERAEALKLDLGESSVSFVFTNPITLAMVSGVARNYNGLVLEFTPDIPAFIMNLSPGTKIDIASMKIGDKIENVFAEVMSNDAKKLALAIKKLS